MPKTIRERIENTKYNDWLNVGNPRLALMDILWRAGNLIPADEVDARVAAAEHMGMERAAQLLVQKADKELVGTVHYSALQDHAAAIRADMERL